LLTESNELNAKATLPQNIQQQPTILTNNENSSSSLSYNGLSDTTLQDDDDNNQSVLEGLEKEKNKEVNYYVDIYIYMLKKILIINLYI